MTDKLQARIREMRGRTEETARGHVSAVSRGSDGLPVDGICAVCPDTQWPCPIILLTRDVARALDALEKALAPRGSDDRDEITAGMIYGTGSANPEGERVHASAISRIRSYRMGMEQEALARVEEALSK